MKGMGKWHFVIKAAASSMSKGVLAGIVFYQEKNNTILAILFGLGTGLGFLSSVLTPNKAHKEEENGR